MVEVEVEVEVLLMLFVMTSMRSRMIEGGVYARRV